MSTENNYLNLMHLLKEYDYDAEKFSSKPRISQLSCWWKV